MAVWIPASIFQPKVARENGPMEVLQDAFLFVGLAVLLHTLKDTRRNAQLFASGVSLFYATFFLRELDVRFITHGLLRSLINGWLKNRVLFLAWGIIGIISLLRIREVWDEFMLWLRYPAGKQMIAACFLYLVGAVCDKSPWNHHDFLEEMCEVGATWLMLLSALAARELWQQWRQGDSNP